MALRAVPDHPKFANLKATIRQPKGATLGWLEAIWHFAGRFTPQGNIGKYPDQAIETWVEWDGKPGALIAALIQTGWIDVDSTHRLLVHDWNQHADKATKNALQRANLTLFVRTSGVQCTYKNPEIEPAYRLPEPVPVPEPVPEPDSNTPPRAKKPLAEIETLYKLYPRHIGKEAARKAITKALSKKPFEDLLLAVHAFVRKCSQNGTEEQFIPHPASWFNAGRYDDEEFQPGYTIKPKGANANGKRNGKDYDALYRELGLEDEGDQALIDKYGNLPPGSDRL